MPHGIIQCSLLHMNYEFGDTDFQSTEGGSVCSVDGDDLRYPIEAKIQCKAGKPPSIIYHVSVDNQPTEVQIMSNFVNDIPIGRQSNEISNLLSIHKTLLLDGLSSSPSISTFISFLNMVAKKLGLSSLSLFICEEEEHATIYSQCEDDEIKPYIEKFSQEFFKNKHRKGEIFKYDIGNYRLGVHSLIIQNCRYMVILALKSSTYILRNVEYFIHAIFSILITHNHKKLSRFVSHRTIGKSANLWNSDIACAEYVNNQYSWSIGSLYNKKATKEVMDEVYFRVQSAFELKLNKMINFIVPMWQTPSSRSILEVYAISTICKMREIPVLTFIVRDVTELFGKGLYDDHFLTSSLLGAVMFGLQRVKGQNLELEVRPTAERFLGEIPPISFSTLTWIADSKLLTKFSTEEKKSLNLIKKSGEMIAAATVPLSGTDDFMFYPLPELSSALSNVMISNGRIDDSKNDVRVSFFDLLMDTCLDIRGQLKKRKISELDIPELSECPRIKQHIQLLAGCLYYNDIDQFYSCVQDSFKYGKSSCLIHLHEKAVIRPFLVNSQHKNDILTIVMMSLEEENYIVNHGSVVLCAMDAQPTTHHIFPWRFQFIETADCIYSTTPGGAYPTMFSKSSMVHMVIPDQRRHLVAQLESGNVNLLILIKYDRARWYILKGTRVGDEIHGMNVLAPYGSVPYLLRPEKVTKLANTLLKSFKKLSEKIEVDLSSLNETVNNLKDVEIDFSSFY
ncbi:hypothetical protein TVAG_400370 [Trichomonas vaginalis G3]|uniref:Uncharacterized protein n=1 Tax=Trichomonas vaginalis (strain ATCC PRA-98 / G3) TaxID=412133 RepID=A2F7F9_TRIV3|nr:hypothetical protein TVAGG3_0224630 [Trichomonas vaginalis G3]EAX99175.1 hypothetical protein TVAG_400370 [Trichomonas vaginalis G3]KAI5552184.1 hypothetical protein TVAGG3_0224630 [Trichomonas vaginalis G3]|eukprot:XP_001312105.1 hypothetical protein [Trichomonas vaginalis G3]